MRVGAMLTMPTMRCITSASDVMISWRSRYVEEKLKNKQVKAGSAGWYLSFSGLELRRLPRGDSTQAVIVLVTLAKVAIAAASAPLHEEVHAPHPLAAATTRPAKTIDVNATRIAETDHVVPRTVTVRWRTTDERMSARMVQTAMIAKVRLPTSVLWW
jgi:hypothetical protein